MITRDELVQQMGGELTMTSQYGAGSTFTVALPLVRPNRDDGRVPDEANQSAASDALSRVSASYRRSQHARSSGLA